MTSSAPSMCASGAARVDTVVVTLPPHARTNCSATTPTPDTPACTSTLLPFTSSRLWSQSCLSDQSIPSCHDAVGKSSSSLIELITTALMHCGATRLLRSFMPTSTPKILPRKKHVPPKYKKFAYIKKECALVQNDNQE
ncbi:hypothetical protein E2C01_001609 [Portunus trituberculatus]|uniref:Uncharacterized protein n=1 Tax=Portunus trituberculatus TaxID=210409 RepID=A0A5B7CII7_PORTR|nr:hypothetical protein [Portunus trituberculatus]